MLVNAIVALLATGGSTNHTMHWVAIARAAGFEMTWQDIGALSRVTPLLTGLYPNDEADVNEFNRVGGTAFLLRELLDTGHMHDDVDTVVGRGLSRFTQALSADTHKLTYVPAVEVSENLTVLRPFAEPFSAESGLRLLRAISPRPFSRFSQFRLNIG